MLIEIINWEKFNPRGNEKKKFHCHWYRVNQGIFSDPQFADFDAGDFVVFLYVLDTTCAKQGKPWKLNFSFCAGASRLSEAQFRSGVDKLLELQVVRLIDDVRTNKGTLSAIQDRTGQNRTGRTEQGKQKQTVPKQDNLPIPSDSVPVPIGNQVSACIGVYYRAFQDRYKTKIRPTKKDAGILQRVVKSLGGEQTATLLQVYLQSDDPWFLKRHHDLATFESNLNQLQVNLQSGATHEMRKEKEKGDALIKKLEEIYGPEDDNAKNETSLSKV